MSDSQSSLKKRATFTNGNRRAVVFHDADNAEYVVHFFTAPGDVWRRAVKADYFTGDRADAMGTACVQIGLPAGTPDDAKKRRAERAAGGAVAYRSIKLGRVAEGQTVKVIEIDPLASETTRTYALTLQGDIAFVSKMSRNFLSFAEDSDAAADYWNAMDERAAAVNFQERAAKSFSRLAGVRGLFDTPCMDDAHAVECEPSRIGPPFVRRVPRALPVGYPICFMTDEEIQLNRRELGQTVFEGMSTSYRERAFNCYGRYAMYCARAVVAPLPFAEWFADCYSGNERDPSANWN